MTNNFKPTSVSEILNIEPKTIERLNTLSEFCFNIPDNENYYNLSVVIDNFTRRASIIDLEILNIRNAMANLFEASFDDFKFGSPFFVEELTNEKYSSFYKIGATPLDVGQVLTHVLEKTGHYLPIDRYFGYSVSLEMFHDDQKSVATGIVHTNNAMVHLHKRLISLYGLIQDAKMGAGQGENNENSYYA